MKRLPVIIIVIILLGLGYILLLSKLSNGSETVVSNPNAILYFWSETCPHCENVAAFLESYPEKDKIILDKKEVSKDRGNANLLAKESANCNIPADQMGVPLLITKEGKCLTGDTPIIDYFKSLFPESAESATISATPN